MAEKKKSATMDLLSGPLWNKILLIALPMAFTEILQQLFNSADIAIVGNFVPDPSVATAAVAAIGNNSAIVSLLVTLFFGLSIGTTVAISQAVGQGKYDSIQKTIGTSIILVLVCGVRIVWVFAIFPMVRTFTFLMAAYPISLVINTISLIIMFFYFHKSLKERQNKWQLQEENYYLILDFG